MYVWYRVGDQDEGYRLICPHGEYLFEHVEDHWDRDMCMMASIIYKWNPETNGYEDTGYELPYIEYNRNYSHKSVEDWFALNILSEKLFTGADDVKNNSDQTVHSEQQPSLSDSTSN